MLLQSLNKSNSIDDEILNENKTGEFYKTTSSINKTVNHLNENDFSKLYNKLINNSTSILIIFFGFIILPCICICFCLKKKSRSKKFGLKLKAKINRSNVDLKQPVSTSALNTSATISQNEESISVTNIQIDNDLFIPLVKENLKIKQADTILATKKIIPTILYNKEDSHNTQSLDRNTREEISYNQLNSTKLDHDLIDKNLLIKNIKIPLKLLSVEQSYATTPFSLSSQINDKGRQRIKNYIKSNPDKIRVIKFKKNQLRNKLSKNFSISTRSSSENNIQR